MTTRKKIGTLLGFAALFIAVLSVFLWFRQVNLVALPQDRTLFVTGFSLAILAGIAAPIVGARWFGVIPAVLAIVVGGFMTATVAISKQQVADNPIKVGDVIPGFVALDDSGSRFNSNELNGSPSIIKFFRGHW